MTDVAQSKRPQQNITWGIISFMWTRPFSDSDHNIVDRARSLGFGAFELVMPEPGSINFHELGQRLKSHQMASALTARVDASTDPCSDDPEIRSKASEYLRTCIDAASQMGASVVGGPLLGSPLVFAGRRPQMLTQQERKRRFERCSEHLSKLAPYAEECGIKLAVEPVNRFETDVINLVDQTLELIDAVGAGNVIGVLLDTFHANIEEKSIPEAITTAGSRLLHVHANENHRGVVGTGHLPWPEIIQTLEKVQFCGQVVLEPFRRHDNGFSVPLATWRPPAAEEDQQVAQSLQYLQSLLGAKAHRAET